MITWDNIVVILSVYTITSMNNNTNSIQSLLSKTLNQLDNKLIDIETIINNWDTIIDNNYKNKISLQKIDYDKNTIYLISKDPSISVNIIYSSKVILNRINNLIDKKLEKIRIIQQYM